MAQALYDVRLYGKVDGPVVFFFCPFGVRSWQLAVPGLPIHSLVRRGYRVISYSYSATIANKAPDLTLSGIEGMLGDAQARIAKLPAGKRITTFGSSMGSVMATNLAAREPRIRDVVLNLSYSDIAQHIYRLPAIPLIPRGRLDSYIKASGGEAGLHELFDTYSPIHLAPKLTGKRILLYQAKNDRLLQYVDTKHLADEFRKHGAHVEAHNTHKASHYGSVLYNYLRPKVFTKFLNDI